MTEGGVCVGAKMMPSRDDGANASECYYNDAGKSAPILNSTQKESQESFLSFGRGVGGGRRSDSAKGTDHSAVACNLLPGFDGRLLFEPSKTQRWHHHAYSTSLIIHTGGVAQARSERRSAY